jgi:two-component system response regulator
MIVICPGCGSRYRLGDDLLARGRRTLRCSGCGEVFDAGAPAAPPRMEAPRAPSRPEAPLALIADLDPQSSALARRILEELGCRVQSVSDGEQAFRFAVTRRPRLLILHLKLPKLSGLAVCEGVKGSPDLKETRVALFGPPGWLARAERMVPAARYADDRFEAGVSPVELRRRLALLLKVTEAPEAPARPVAVARVPAPGPASPPARAPASAPAPSQAPASAKGASLSPQAEIRRMARAILSDLKCYHPDLFRQAVETGRFLEVFKAELAQCKEVVAQRFPELPDRLVLLSSALKEGIDEERAQAV